MEWYIVLAIILCIPIVLLPAAFIWYINVSGIYTVIRETIRRRAIRRRREKEARLAKEVILK